MLLIHILFGTVPDQNNSWYTKNIKQFGITKLNSIIKLQVKINILIQQQNSVNSDKIIIINLKLI